MTVYLYCLLCIFSFVWDDVPVHNAVQSQCDTVFVAGLFASVTLPALICTCRLHFSGSKSMEENSDFQTGPFINQTYGFHKGVVAAWQFH